MWRQVKQHLPGLILAIIVGFFPALAVAQNQGSSTNRELAALANEFETWRAINQPVTPSAILRINRPADWNSDWTQSALVQRKSEYRQLQSRQKSLNTLGYTTADRVDQVLLGAAMERIHWQLEILGIPRRNPGFYIEQTLGSVYEILIETPEPDQSRMEALTERLLLFPTLFNTAKLMLDHTVPELAQAAVERLGDTDQTVDLLEESLTPFLVAELEEDFALGLRAARQSLASYKDWLTASLPRFTESPAIGEPRLRWYLGHVSMIPRSPEAILVETEMTMARIGAQLALNKQLASQSVSNSPYDNVSRLVQISGIIQGEISNYMQLNALASPDENSPGFELLILPQTVNAIRSHGEPQWVSISGNRAGYRFLVPEQGSADLLESSAWTDPRLLLTWYGYPGLQRQVSRASDHPREIRRQASGETLSNGLSLYFHEQLTESGLYSLKPASFQLALEIIELKAVLAHTDIRLARGEWSAKDAVRFIIETLERPASDALNDVWRLIARPGAASAEFAAYQQAVRFVSDALRQMGEEFSLQEFNDRLLLNAHVPIALQRWEYLDIDDELEQLIELRGRPATVPE